MADSSTSQIRRLDKMSDSPASEFRRFLETWRVHHVDRMPDTDIWFKFHGFRILLLDPRSNSEEGDALYDELRTFSNTIRFHEKRDGSYISQMKELVDFNRK